MTFKESAAATQAKQPEGSRDENRRQHPTRRLKARPRHSPTEALKNAFTPAEMVKAMSRKANEFVEACFLELGLTARIDVTRTVQQALLRDFIEIHNAAADRIIRLPENAEDIEKLAR